MARVPDPVPGLIFRYGYLWLSELRSGRIDPSKERPACLLVRILEGERYDLRLEGGLVAAVGDVVILPITTRPPEPTQAAMEMTVDEKQACGLDKSVRSWVILSEFNVDTWPHPDISLVVATGKLSYGIAPSGLLKRFRRAFAEASLKQRAVGVRR
jgi:hypothetical protein